MEEGLYKIWYIEFDEDGKEIGRGVHGREYKNYGSAVNMARKRYYDHNRFKWRIAMRDPWVDYTKQHKCEICGWTYERPESVEGYDMGERIRVPALDADDYTTRRHSDYYRCCPVCSRAVVNFINDIRLERIEKNEN